MTGMAKRNTYMKTRSAIRCMQKLQKRQDDKSKDDFIFIGLLEKWDSTIEASYHENGINHVEILKSEAEVEAFFLLNKIDPEDPNTLIASEMPYSVGVKLGRYDDA